MALLGDARVPVLKNKLTWSDVKSELANFDRVGLLALVQDLYAARKENQTFLHARFGLGADVLKPYSETIERWLWPNVLRNHAHKRIEIAIVLIADVGSRLSPSRTSYRRVTGTHRSRGWIGFAL